MKNKKAVSDTQNSTFTFSCRNSESRLQSLKVQSRDVTVDSESKTIEMSFHTGSVILLHPAHFRDDTASLALACS